MPAPFHWTGRQDPEDGINAKRWHQIVQTEKTHDSFASLIGFACDTGVKRNKGRAGAALGPIAIRTALANLAWHGKDGIVCDMGDIPCDEDLDAAQTELGQAVGLALTDHQKVLVLGGGHETAAGSFQGFLKLLKSTPGKTVGIINLDAHFDLRKPGENGISSGTPFYQIHEMLASLGQKMKYLCLGVSETANTQALFDRAHAWDVDYLLDKHMRPHLLANIQAKIDQFLTGCDYLYLSIDLDVLPHWQMPAVSAPAPYGVSLDVVEDIIEHLASTEIDWLLSDMVEFNPHFDQDGRGAKVAARLCDTILRAMTR